MSLFSIAWRSIQQRSLASALTALSMALGVMLVVVVLSIHGVVSDSFRSNASLGYNMIVGAKGGKLQLTLNTVYYLSQPVENISYAYYLEFLTAEQRKREEADPGTLQLDGNGQFSQYTDFAIPLCLGDYVGSFRSIGTTPDFFEKLVFGPNNDRKFEFAEGRCFEHHHAEHGFFEAVAGAVAARELGLKVGDQLNPTHGDPEGHTHAQGFTVVGILAPSGTPNDRAVFVNIEGFYLMADHAKTVGEHGAEETHDHAGEEGSEVRVQGSEVGVQGSEVGVQGSEVRVQGSEVRVQGLQSDSEEHADEQEGHAHDEASGAKDQASGTTPDHSHDQPADDHDHAGHEHEHGRDHDHGAEEPLPMVQREVTAILVRTAGPQVTPGLHNMINEGRDAQAVLPVAEIYSLFEVIVSPIQTVLLVLTAMICVVSGVSILISIYNSMSERRHEIAVMRALGAGRDTVMVIILLESVLLALGGGAAGWLIAHALNWLASPVIAAQTGVSIGFWDMDLAEALLIPSILLLAVLCGFFPAVSAYRTDVAKSL